MLFNMLRGKLLKVFQIGKYNCSIQDSEFHFHLLNTQTVASSDIKTNLALSRNNYYTGRERDIEILQQELKSFNIAVIAGDGGVGKTQIALEYLFRNWVCYETIWWVDSETIPSITNSFRQFAIAKGLLSQGNFDTQWITWLVHNWLMKNRDWVFVFDNADNQSLILNYLPSRMRNDGHIIITSRASSWDIVNKAVEVAVFDQKDAEDFIIRRTGIDDREGARKLVKELDNFPLVLEQAGAYIKKNKKSLEEYINLLKKSKINLLANRKYKPNNYNYTVTTTWNISLEKIHNMSSLQLLHLCAFLAPDNINKTIFVESYMHLPEPLSKDVQNESDYDEVISELTEYSLIKLQNNKLSLHRLLQEVIQNTIDKKDWLKYCLSIILEVFKFDYYNQSNWNKCAELFFHALSVAKHLDEIGVDLEKAASVYYLTAKSLVHTADYKEAEPLFQRALKIREEVLGENHPDTASTLNSLAALYRRKENDEEAETLLRKALQIRVEVLGENHPDTASTLNSFAWLYLYRKDYEKAEFVLQRALKIREDVFGEDHPATASTLNNLAVLNFNKGNIAKAESLYKRALKIREKVLGEIHPDTANSLNNLAVIYIWKRNMANEAEHLFERALKIREQVLGENHRDTAISLYDLGILYMRYGCYEEAEHLWQRALRIRKKVLGENHPDTATSLTSLAILYVRKRDYAEAEHLFLSALKIREEIFGENHLDTAISLNNLAKLYKNQGKYKEAMLLSQRALNIVAEADLEEKHPYKATSLKILAGLYLNQKKYKEAKLLYKRALKKRRGVLRLRRRAFLKM